MRAWHGWMNNCCVGADCPEDVATSGTNVGADKAIRPPLGTDNDVFWGNFPAGTYKVSYCGGAWRYNYDEWSDDWVTTKVPTGSIGISGRAAGLEYDFFTIKYQSGGADAEIGFGGSRPGGHGFASQALAEAAAPTYVNITHSGGPIGISFMDNDNTDNLAGTPSPTFGLKLEGCGADLDLGITPLYALGHAVYGFEAEPPEDTLYTLRFYFSKDDENYFENVYCRLVLGDDIKTTTTAGPFQIYGQSTAATFYQEITFTLSNNCRRNPFAVVQFFGGALVPKYFVFDLTPTLFLVGVNGYAQPLVCPGAPTLLDIAAAYCRGLPILRLVGTVDTSAGSDVELAVADDCTTEKPFVWRDVHEHRGTAINHATFGWSNHVRLKRRDPEKSPITVNIRWRAEGASDIYGDAAWCPGFNLPPTSHVIA